MRSEDINARQVQQAFANGATLAELEQHIAYLRSRGAPDDAHPRAGVNDDYEITVMICVVQRPAPPVARASSLRPETRPGLRAGPAGKTAVSRVRRRRPGSRCPGFGADGPATEATPAGIVRSRPGWVCSTARRPGDSLGEAQLEPTPLPEPPDGRCRTGRPEHCTRTTRPLAGARCTALFAAVRGRAARAGEQSVPGRPRLVRARAGTELSTPGMACCGAPGPGRILAAPPCPGTDRDAVCFGGR